MTPWSLWFDVGIGDFINAESFWSPEKKAALEVVHHAFWDVGRSVSLIEAMNACPAFAHVEHRGLAYPTQPVPGAVHCLRDHPITHRLAYHGSSLLEHPLAAPPPDLPARFAFIQHSTPKNGPNCYRFIHDAEWPHVVEILETLDAVGLVVNMSGGRSTIPAHPRLVDHTGRTTYPQSVEILKRAVAYVGVDSNFAILAAQLFPADRLFIKCNNPYLIDNPWWTYPPQREPFAFLYPRIGQAPHKVRRPAPEPGTIVELRCNALVGGRTYGSHSRVEVEPDRAGRMIESGQAVPVAAEDLD